MEIPVLYLYPRGMCGRAGGIQTFPLGVSLGVGIGGPVARGYCDCGWTTPWTADDGQSAQSWSWRHYTGAPDPRPDPNTAWRIIFFGTLAFVALLVVIAVVVWGVAIASVR